ncbi:MAG TPA: OstA-like protein [Candidatus Kapabacteria bacterium]|nr:OstA-like protein [Candidatus Kapabacteria bacterium]
MLCALSDTAAFAQGSGLVTVTAESFSQSTRDGQPVQHLSGNVRFSQGNLYGSADEAFQFMLENRLELRGNVIIRQDTLELKAPRVDYDGVTRIGHAEGGVRLSDRDNVLTAYEGDYDMNSQIAIFHNNVRIAQGNTIITSNDLTYFRATQTSVAKGKVQVKSDTGVLHADQVTHVRALGEMTAVGNVVLNSDSLDMSSDWLYNSEPQDLMFARGKVVVIAKANNTIISGDTLARFGKRQYIHVPRSPLLRIADSSITRDSLSGRDLVTYDTAFVKASEMEIFQGDSARFIATDSVRMIRSTFSATGGKMIYDQKNELIRLFANDRQRMWYDSTEIVGDSIAIHLKDNRVERAFAFGRTFATSPLEIAPSSANDERVNQMQGESMTLRVERDTLRDMLVANNALSMYFLLSDGKLDGVNRASGDSIRLDFAGRAVKRVTIISGTEGEYFPEAFVRGRGSAFRLTAYSREYRNRPRREEFVNRWEVASSGASKTP